MKLTLERPVYLLDLSTPVLSLHQGSLRKLHPTTPQGAYCWDGGGSIKFSGSRNCLAYPLLPKLQSSLSTMGVHKVTSNRTTSVSPKHISLFFSSGTHLTESRYISL